MSFFQRTDTNDLAIPRVLVADLPSCARQQAIDILSLWAGEWFLDQAVGFPWNSLMGLKILNTTQIDGLLKEAILSVQGVVSVTAQVLFNRAARAFSYSFTAQLATGDVLTGGSNQAFSVANTPAGA